MTVLSKIKSHSHAAEYFKELPFFNKPIKKPKFKRLKNIDQLAELPFYEQLSVIKTNQAFRGYAKLYKDINLVSKILFKKFYTWLIIGLMMDLTGLLNQSSHNTLTSQLIDYYQEVLT